MSKHALTVTPSKATKLIKQVLLSKLVPMLAGSPGIGKSDIIKSVAKDFNLEVIDLRLSQCDPVILNGLPTKVEGQEEKDSDKISFLPMDFFPIEGDKLPDGKDGWLLFLDEINSAPTSVQAAAYKLILDKQVGKHNLHKRVAIVAAGNLASDKAIVNKQGTAMQSRLVHLQLQVDTKAWMDWAASAGIDTRVSSYINWKKDMLHRFNPDHDDVTFPCPRTWEFAARLIEGEKVSVTDSLELLAGTVGVGAARDFISYCEVFKDLHSYDEVVKDPKGIKVPSSPGTRHAMTSVLVSEFDAKDIDPIMDYLDRLDMEYQMFTLETLVRRNTKLTSNPRINKWIIANAKYM